MRTFCASLDIFTDGACQGNPGEAAVGIVIKENSTTIKEISLTIGRATNNIAEYCAVIFALKEALSLKAQDVCIFCDSQLICYQVIGHYKIKEDHLKDLNKEVQELRRQFRSFKIQHIPRTENKRADQLATHALKEKQPPVVVASVPQ